LSRNPPPPPSFFFFLFCKQVWSFFLIMAASKLEFRTEKCPHCKNDITGDSTSIRNHKIRCKVPILYVFLSCSSSIFMCVCVVFFLIYVLSCSKGVDVTKDRGWLESSQDAGKSTGADKKDNSGADQKHKSGADQK